MRDRYAGPAKAPGDHMDPYITMRISYFEDEFMQNLKRVAVQFFENTKDAPIVIDTEL